MQVSPQLAQRRNKYLVGGFPTYRGKDYKALGWGPAISSRPTTTAPTSTTRLAKEQAAQTKLVTFEVAGQAVIPALTNGSQGTSSISSSSMSGYEMK